MSDVIVTFPDGTAGDLARLQREYGANIRVLHSLQPRAFRLSRINVISSGETIVRVWVRGADGLPAIGQPCTYTFPRLDQPNPDLEPISAAMTLDRWSERGVLNKNRVDGAGRVEFEIGRDSWIRDGRGPYSVFVLSPTIGSDCLDGIGWMMATNHVGPCELFFVADTIPEPDDPPPTDITGALARINATLDRLATHLGA